MGDFLDFDQLIRIRRATEKMANNAISVADYNAVVRQNEALRQEVMRLQASARHWESESLRFERNRDEFRDYGRAVKAERDFFDRQSERLKTRVAELEKENAALKGRKA
ncbi:hypothetical protein [Komagataeibacter rhaeticus]|uniref:hypothetical protein n=1 Tax=Komagataeibacter rhaeticus TaxID=215221 RepID=UPI001CD3081D|nr:hypothetical protein [Komagataeibacter rhaeticus]